MEKKIIAVLCCIIAILVALLINNSSFSSKEIIENENYEILNKQGALTMMYETDVGSNQYQVSSDTTWPQEGYIFNADLSACERGSRIYWDDERKTVMVEASTSDKCYVYFDKYTTVRIINVTTSNITNNSITLTAKGAFKRIKKNFRIW